MLCFSLCTLLSFSGSGAAASPPEGLAPEEITRLSIHYSHMSSYSKSSFDLRDDKGEILFSCNFFTVDGQEITLKDVPVVPEYMRRLRETAKEHDFAQIQGKRPPSKFFVHDAPMSGMNIEWPGGKSKYFNYWPTREVETLFREIADACVNKPGAPEEVSALYYTYVHTRRTESFRFDLCHDEGEFLFSARYYPEGATKVVAFEYVPVDPAHMQRLWEIVRAHGIANMRGKALHHKETTPPYPYAMLSLYWPDMRFVQLGQPASGNEELEAFFRDLAQEYAPKVN